MIDEDEWEKNDDPSMAMNGAIFAGADFSGADVANAKFHKVSDIKGAIFIGAKFNKRSFTPKQFEQIILTEKELGLALQVSSAAEKINLDEKTIKEKDAVLEYTSKEAVNRLEEIFEQILKRFAREERIWTLFIGLTFFGVL